MAINNRNSTTVPKVLLLSPGSPGVTYSGGVLRKVVDGWPKEKLYWAYLNEDGGKNESYADCAKAFPNTKIHWRLEKSIIILLMKMMINAKIRANKIACWAKNHNFDVLWVLAEGSAVDVAYYLQPILRVPMHLTFYDAPKVCITEFCGCNGFYASIYLRRVDKLVRMAYSIDGVSEELVQYIRRMANTADLKREMTFPSSLQKSVIESLPLLKCWQKGDKVRKIAFCGTMRTSRKQWQNFISTLGSLPYYIEILLFANKDYFYDVIMPPNVHAVLQAYEQTEYLLMRRLVDENVHAAYLGLWSEPDKRLFAQTSLSSKLTTYCAAGIPVIVDGPEDSVAWRLVKKYGAGVLFRSSAGSSDSLLKLFEDQIEWKKMAESSRIMCDKEFNYDVNISKFQNILKEDVIDWQNNLNKGVS